MAFSNLGQTNDNDDTQIKGPDGTLLTITAANAAKVDGSAVTQPISAASLPLPTGASTSSLQTTGNASLASIDTKTPTVGQKTMANSRPVVIASDQSGIPLKGGTDSTTIGNTGDRLRVDAQLTSVGSGIVGNFSSNLAILPTFTPISISSTSVYTTIYTYTGSGLILGFNYEFSAGRAVVKFVIDGVTIMDGNDVGTLNGLFAATNNTARLQAGSGLVTQSSNIDLSFRYPLKFNSSVTISAKLSGGAAVTMNQGIIYIQKDT